MDLVGIQKWEYLAIGLNRSAVLLGIDYMPRPSTVFYGVKPRIPPRALAVTVRKRNSTLLEMSEFQVRDVENGLNSFPRLPWSMSYLPYQLGGCTAKWLGGDWEPQILTGDGLGDSLGPFFGLVERHGVPNWYGHVLMLILSTLKSSFGFQNIRSFEPISNHRTTYWGVAIMSRDGSAIACTSDDSFLVLPPFHGVAFFRLLHHFSQLHSAMFGRVRCDFAPLGLRFS